MFPEDLYFKEFLCIGCIVQKASKTQYNTSEMNTLLMSLEVFTKPNLFHCRETSPSSLLLLVVCCHDSAVNFFHLSELEPREKIWYALSNRSFSFSNALLSQILKNLFKVRLPHIQIFSFLTYISPIFDSKTSTSEHRLCRA